MKNFNIQSGTMQAQFQINLALRHFLSQEHQKPVFICIGSDLLCGDSLGPLVGHLLTTRYNLNGFVYGTLKNNVTAKNVERVTKFVRAKHHGCKIVAIDAALGNACDIGLIRVLPKGILPAAAFGKDLGVVGDISITAIVNRLCKDSNNFLHYTRLYGVWTMAEEIARGVALCFSQELLQDKFCV